MKRLFTILCLGVVVSLWADDYVDDVYFLPSEQAASSAPYYDRAHMQPLVFELDTVPPAASDSLSLL